MGLGLGADAKLVYTYDVYWELSDISWASRWDAYLRMPGGRVHWFSILNSLMVVVVMSSIVAMIMMRTIRRDLQRYEGLLGESSAPSQEHLHFLAVLYGCLGESSAPPQMAFTPLLFFLNATTNPASHGLSQSPCSSRQMSGLLGTSTDSFFCCKAHEQSLGNM